jgi:hypothetical protein
MSTTTELTWDDFFTNHPCHESLVRDLVAAAQDELRLAEAAPNHPLRADRG